MNDKTRIRIAVPAHLYESVKKQLTLKEGKQNFGSGYTPVKEKKNPGMTKAKTEGFEDEIGYEAGEQKPAEAGYDQDMAMEKRMAKMEKAIMEMYKEIMSKTKVEEKKSDSEEEEEEE
jgi:hypothetical protein